MNLHELVVWAPREGLLAVSGIAETCLTAKRNGLGGVYAVQVYALAGCLINRGRPNHATDLLRELVSATETPENVRVLAWTRLGRCERLLGRYELSLSALGIAIETAQLQQDVRNSLRAQLEMSKTLRISSRVDEAEGTLLAVIEVSLREPGLRDEFQPAALWDLAAMRDRQGRYLESAELLFEAIQLKLGKQDLLRLLGDLGIKLRTFGWYDSAQDAFDAVTEYSSVWSTQTNAWIESLYTAVEANDHFRYRRAVKEVRVRFPRSAALEQADANARVQTNSARRG